MGTRDRAGQHAARPAPPPEAELIRLAREASPYGVVEAARRAGISRARWSQIESGYEKRGAAYKPVSGPSYTIAHMAHAIGLDPERLETQGCRPDAAAVLREILRKPDSTPGERENPEDDPVRLLLPPEDYEALSEYQRTKIRKALQDQAMSIVSILRPPA